MKKHVNRKETFRQDLFIALQGVWICVYGYGHSGTKLKFFSCSVQVSWWIHYFSFHVDALRKSHISSQKLLLAPLQEGYQAWHSFMLLILDMESSLLPGIFGCGPRDVSQASWREGTFHCFCILPQLLISVSFLLPNYASRSFLGRVTFFSQQAV